MKNSQHVDTKPDSATRVRVMLVDDNSTDRHLLSLLLSQDENFEVVGEACDGAEAIDLARKLRPDAIVLDLVMPCMDGFQALDGLRSVSPESRILACSVLDEDFGQDAVEFGADDHISKKDAWDHIHSRIFDLMTKPPARATGNGDWFSAYLLAAFAKRSLSE